MEMSYLSLFDRDYPQLLVTKTGRKENSKLNLLFLSFWLDTVGGGFCFLSYFSAGNCTCEVSIRIDDVYNAGRMSLHNNLVLKSDHCVG